MISTRGLAVNIRESLAEVESLAMREEALQRLQSTPPVPKTYAAKITRDFHAMKDAEKADLQIHKPLTLDEDGA